jgi:phospholipase C
MPSRLRPTPARARHPRPVRPVQHVVLIIKENHMFDNYFGTFPGADGLHLPGPPTRRTRTPTTATARG